MKRPITNAVVDRVVEGAKSSISPLHSQGQHWEANTIESLIECVESLRAERDEARAERDERGNPPGSNAAALARMESDER